MILRRLHVEEGFLDGLDVTFEPGLNVVIGARGTGKTSIVELLRFGLGADDLTESRPVVGGESHALSVLRGGRVSIRLDMDGTIVDVVRGADDREPRSNGRYLPPIVLAQNEIEHVGVESRARLQLIDRFRPNRDELESAMGSSRAELRSLTTQLRSVVSEISSVVEQATEMGDVRSALEAAQADEKSVLASMEASSEQTDNLHFLQKSHADLASREATIAHSRADLEKWARALAATLGASPALPAASDAAKETDPVEVSRTALGTSRALVAQAIDVLNTAVATLETLATTNAAQRIKLDEQSRSLRQALEAVQRGASAASRRVQTLQEQLGQLGALETVEKTRKYQLSELSQRRERAFEELLRLRDARFEERLAAAKQLTSDLGPRIRVEVAKSALDGSYASAILAALRGTGMHAKELAPLLARCMTPLELVQAVESDDPRSIAVATGLTLDRAIRVVQSLRDGDTAEIIAADIDDDAEMSLLDGTDYKATDTLSMGQRCSVILPVLLNTAETLLVIDQPEDHLDNAYVVDTLVRSLQARSAHSQTIITTHNANIPVLGDASNVIQLGSDGESGYELASGHLRDADVVDAITSVMEGGAEAFSRRASFYGLP